MSASRPSAAQRWTRRLAKLAAALALLVLGGLFVWALEARSMPALAPWHERAPDGEFTRRTAGEGFALEDYLALEARLFEELERERIDLEQAGEGARFCRYTRGGPCDPARVAPDWNRSFRLAPAGERRGAFLLLHGLTDSPYSLRALAEALAADGYEVLALRLPGHGTTPAALLHTEWEDWVAAVRVAARGLAEGMAPGERLNLLGYSTGGALAVHYAARALREGSLPPAGRLVLLSPALGVSAFARFSNWHKVFSWLPPLRKSAWLSIDPEYDPYKYSSFPKNAGAQVWRLARAVQAELDALQDEGRAGELPPVLAFQSVADATVLASELVLGLFDRLPVNGSELVGFDLNRSAHLEGFLRHDHAAVLAALEEAPPPRFRFTLVTNADADSAELVERSRHAGSTEVATRALGLAWPPLVYSLSHVALPFPPDDPTYGIEPLETGGDPPLLGSLMLRGESGLLAIPADQRLRLRYNPFHGYLVGVLRDTLAGRR